MDSLVEECAYHVFACGDMSDRGAYGRVMCTQYPSLLHAGIHPWVSDSCMFIRSVYGTKCGCAIHVNFHVATRAVADQHDLADTTVGLCIVNFSLGVTGYSSGLE